jgi:hypothetical protein
MPPPPSGADLFSMPNHPGPCPACGARAAGHGCAPAERPRAGAARAAAGAVLLVFAVIVAILAWLTTRLAGSGGLLPGQ